MPVYILDNGRSWSDHQIWIVEPASAKKARDLAAILVPNIWEFDGGIEFKEIWK